MVIDKLPVIPNVVPFQDNLGELPPPNLNVPASKSNSDPAVELKFADTNFPVDILSPDILVELGGPVGILNNAAILLAVNTELYILYSDRYPVKSSVGAPPGVSSSPPSSISSQFARDVFTLALVKLPINSPSTYNFACAPCSPTMPICLQVLVISLVDTTVPRTLPISR